MDLFDLTGKVAVVTGGTRGIGLMMARGLLQAGARVYISSRKPEAGDAAVAELSAYGTVRLGAGRPVHARRSASGWPPRSAEREDELHILVNNAGATWGEPLEAFPESAWDKVLDLNLKSPFFLTRAFLPLLEEAGTARRPGPGGQRRQHRRAARAADAHLLVLGEQGRAAPPDPGAGQGARAAAHHRQRGRARARSSRR